MRLFDPTIFDLNEDIEIVECPLGYEIKNFFNHPEKVCDFVKNDCVFQICPEINGGAPVYRSKIEFHVPCLKNFAHSITEMHNKKLDYLSITANIQSPHLFHLQNNSEPHQDGRSITTIVYLSEMDSGTVLWKRRPGKYNDIITSTSDADTEELLNYKWEKIYTSSGTYNSAFFFNASEIYHTVDYWTNQEDFERVSLALFSMMRR